MSAKVLLNVYSVQVKNDLLSIFVQNGYDVFEAVNENDLLFKHHLIKEKLEIYVHELDENNYESSLEQLKRIDRDKVRCIVMIHAYNSDILDDALALKVKDVIVLPMDRNNLTSKLIMPVQAMKRTSIMPKEPPQPPTHNEEDQAITSTEPEAREFEEAFSQKSLEMELNRSTRGKYPISLLMVTYSNISNEAFALFEERLHQLLRTTDVILRYDKDRVLLLCPFTSKENLVEVENKVGQAHTSLTTKGFDKGLMVLSGVTYPRDASKSDQLIKILESQRVETKEPETSKNLFNTLNDKEIRNRLRKNY